MAWVFVSNQYGEPGSHLVRHVGKLVCELDEDEWSDVEGIVGLRQEGLSWQATSNAMFELECQRLGKKPTLMAPRKWTVWRCREAVKVWEQLQTKVPTSGEQSEAGAV
jgi:hypothetical protein